MKKLVFLFVAFAAVSFASCGNKAANTEVSTETDSVAVVEEAVPAVDTVAAVADTVATDSVAVAE